MRWKHTGITHKAQPLQTLTKCRDLCGDRIKTCKKSVKTCHKNIFSFENKYRNSTKTFYFSKIVVDTCFQTKNRTAQLQSKLLLKLEKIQYWMNANKLTLNYTKTKINTLS